MLPRSYRNPKPPRSYVRESPKTSQANPNRGLKFLRVLFSKGIPRVPFRIGDVHQCAVMSGHLVHLRAELVAQPEIQRQARRHPPVILEIEAEGPESVIPVKLGPRRGGPEKIRLSEQEGFRIGEFDNADGVILEGHELVKPVDQSTELQCMRPRRVEDVVTPCENLLLENGEASSFSDRTPSGRPGTISPRAFPSTRENPGPGRSKPFVRVGIDLTDMVAAIGKPRLVDDRRRNHVAFRKRHVLRARRLESWPTPGRSRGSSFSLSSIV